MAQQTAVEWFYNKISNIEVNFGDGNLIDKIFQQAKEMEKEQIIDAFNDGDFMSCGSEKDAINYYNYLYNK
jgi:hypothetical protein